MPNIAILFKEEMRRLARKEIKENFGKLKQEVTALRRSVSALKRRLDQVEAESRRLKRATAIPARDTGITEDTKKPVRARFTGNAILRLRLKLRLTQAEFAKLIGVSTQSVYQWERREGRLQLRSATKAALVEVRGLGAREARRRLYDR